MDDIHAWATRFRQNGVKWASGPTRQPWGNTEILVIDPFRNTLRFSQLGTHAANA
ncbi:MAG: VOC family protein [Myxococcota bacterium]